ncbi:MAG: C40 family peptidase [Flavobacteriaceae bacterium]|nr:C40 family peptidase [Flavobacteriaceae bacterium]
MLYGICILNSIALRSAPSDSAEMVSQVLFGETFEVVGSAANWLNIKLSFDAYEGWIDNKQQIALSESDYRDLNKLPQVLVGDLVNFLSFNKSDMLTLSLGAVLPFFKNLKTTLNNITYSYEGSVFNKRLSKEKLIDTAFMYLNAPYLWGGRTPFGIDCSGFTQMVYKINGYKILRDASQQASQGEALSFIEESEPGDLAFFDNDEGQIIHVGIILSDHHIIHAHGKVRIDKLDHSGIFNTDTKRHTHKLRVIKKML